MAKEKDTLSPAGVGDAKLKTFCLVTAALAELSRPDQLDVLRAVANFYGLVIAIEAPR